MSADVASAPRRRRRYGFLLVAALGLLFVQGIAPPAPFWQVLTTALAGASLVLALRAAGASRRLVLGAAAATLLACGASLVHATGGAVGDGATRVVNAWLVAVGPPAIALGVIRDLRESGQVRIEALAGVLSLYVLLGMLFAFSYGAIDLLGDEPFFADGAPASVANCVYFSFTTLTTVGYGDLVAGLHLGRTLAVFEALLGQVYLVTVVSLIVSNMGRRAARAGRLDRPAR